jgi:EmrB/QacA subfamily drug resistance transporter
MSRELHRSPLLWLVAVGFLMQTLDATIVNTALPAMAASLGVHPIATQFVVIAYTLSMALLIPASGWLADRFGTRLTYGTALLVFGGASALCALAVSLPMLVAARVLQGCGGALLLPVGRLAVLRKFPPPQFLAAMSFVTVPGLVGPLLGPLLGGWLVVVASWHWIFWINVPIAVLGWMATRRFMPENRARAAGRFDLAGYLMIAAGMVAGSLGVQGRSELGLPLPAVAVLWAFAAISFALYWRHAGRARGPLFARSIFSVQTFRLGLAGNLGSRLGSGGMPFLVPLALQVSLGYSPLNSGLMMVPVALAAMATKSWAPGLITRLGFRAVLIGNTVLVGTAVASLALVTPGAPMALLVVLMGLYGTVNSLQFTAMNSVVLKDLAPHQAGEGNALLSMTQMLAMGLGVAATGALLKLFATLLPADGGVISHGAFQATFVCAGLLTAASALIFARLDAVPARARC